MYLIKNLYVENVSKDQLESVLKACGDKIVWWAYIIHDRDKKENGEPKKSHYHLLIEWVISDHHAKENIVKAFKCLYVGFESQLRVESVRSVHRQARYLMHLDNKEKAAYNKQEVVTSDLLTYEDYISTQIKEKEVDKMLNDLLDIAYEEYKQGVEMTQGDILLYFKKLGRLDYFLKNNTKIYNLISEYIEVMTSTPF